MLSLALGIVLAAPQAAPSFIRFPDLHGSHVAFTSEGDLWIGDLETRTAKRLTSDPGVERNVSFSPDGKSLAFEGEYDSRQAYVMPTSGGIPKRLTYAEGFRAVTDWSADGKNVIFRTTNVPTNYQMASVPVTGGVPKPFPLEFVSHMTFAPDGQRYAFTRFNRWYSAWFHYDGGMQNQIWVREPGPTQFRQITNTPGTNEFPAWCGDRIYFVNETKGKFTLMSVPASGGDVRAELPPSDTEIREMDTDGKRLIFERGVGAEVFDPTTRKATPISFQMTSDEIHARPRTVPMDGFVQGASISPTGKRVWVESRGQIVSLPAGEGAAYVWKSKPGVRFRNSVSSPDGKSIAYFSDASGEFQLYVAKSDGTGEKQLTKDGGRQLVAPKFSPDSKWIAFTDSKMNLRMVNVESGEDKVVANVPMTWFGVPFDFSPDSKWITYSQVAPVTLHNVVQLYEIETGKTTAVSDGRGSDSTPAFSSDGKWLVFVASRRLSADWDPVLNQMNLAPTGIVTLVSLAAETEDPFAPKNTDEGAPAAPAKKPDEKPQPMKVDLEGIWVRRIELPLPPSVYSKVDMVGNRVLAVSAPTSGAPAIQFFDVATKQTGTVIEGASFELSADQTKLLVPGATGFTVIGVTGDDRKAVTSLGLRLSVDPKAEWRQMFYDSWRLLRDYFYVPNMHGVDWPAIAQKYAAYLPSVRSRDELDELLRWMQSELGSSHQYLAPGDVIDNKRRVPGAYLGIDLEADPSGYYRLRKILRGDGFRASERSPLVGVGKNVKEGMIVLEIAGVPAKVGTDPYLGLQGRAGQVVSVVVNTKPTKEGATTLYVRPIPSETRLRYLDWVESNRQYVEKASGGRLGYVHLAAMTTQDMNDFVKQYFGQRDKEGIVVDTRFNNGGNVQSVINQILASRLTGFFNMRDSSLSWTRQGDYFEGPMVCLQNEFNISCGEEFPHRFRDLKLGPVIGRRTMGGEVGSAPGWPLLDGGVVSVPNYGMWTPEDGWVIEGEGVSPDIDVPSNPNAFVSGKDPQLDAGISYLLEDLRKNPRAKPKQPLNRTRIGG